MHEDPPPLDPPATRHTILPESEAEDRPTNPENLELPDVRTMLDPRFMGARDNEFQEAVRVVAEVGRQLEQDRRERIKIAEASAENQATLIEQQQTVIEILLRTEKSTNANYDLMHKAVETLQAITATHASQIETLRADLDTVRTELPDAVHRAIQDAVAPYVEKIENIERRLGEPVQ